MTFETGQIPKAPPPQALAEVDAAWQRTAALAAQDRELHITRDAPSGRTIVQVRSLDGEVVRIIPPSQMLDVMAGAEL